MILVSFYSLLPNKTTPESREECELVGGFDGAGFGDLGVDTDILIEVAHDVPQDGAIGRKIVGNFSRHHHAPRTR